MAFPSPDPPLSDGIVELRLIDKRDRDTIERAALVPDIGQQFGPLKMSPAKYFARYREASRDGSAAAFAVCDMGGECLGLVTVDRREAGRAELAYWLLPEGRGRGRATRALRLVSRWALSQQGVARLYLTVSPDNTASQRVAEGSGFQREGVLRSYHVVDGRREDAVFFSFLPGDTDDDRTEGDELGSVRAGRDASRHLALVAPGLSIGVDELAMGFGTGLLYLSIWLAMAVIGAKAFAFAQLGVRVGARLREAVY